MGTEKVTVRCFINYEKIDSADSHVVSQRKKF